MWHPGYLFFTISIICLNYSFIRSKSAHTFPHAKNSSVVPPQDVAQCESDEDDQALYDEVPGEEDDGSEDDTPYEQMQEEPHYDSVPQEAQHSDDEQEEEYE